MPQRLEFVQRRTRDCGDCCGDFARMSPIQLELIIDLSPQHPYNNGEIPAPGSTLITRRSEVRILPPLRHGLQASGSFSGPAAFRGPASRSLRSAHPGRPGASGRRRVRRGRAAPALAALQEAREQALPVRPAADGRPADAPPAVAEVLLAPFLNSCKLIGFYAHPVR